MCSVRQRGPWWRAAFSGVPFSYAPSSPSSRKRNVETVILRQFLNDRRGPEMVDGATSAGGTGQDGLGDGLGGSAWAGKVRR